MVFTSTTISSSFAGPIDLCLSPVLVRRTGQEGCWAEVSAKSSLQANLFTVCLHRTAWIQWLLNSHGARCGYGIGRWKSFSPAVNLPEDLPKKRLLQFKVSVFNSASSGAFRDRALWWIEKNREKYSLQLAKADSSGVLKKLILDEKEARGVSGPFLRMLGFVHLFSASGIHLYVLARYVNAAVFSIGCFLRLPLSFVLSTGRCISFLVWIVIWLLSGMRAALLRPFLVVAGRQGARILGVRWKSYSPLFLALLFDGGVAFYRSFQGLSPWAPGRWHYALAVGGGLLASEIYRASSTKKHGFQSVFQEHLALALGSWLFTALWDAWSLGIVAVATPLLSLITIPLFCSVVYPLTLAALLFGSFSPRVADQVLSAVGSFAASSIELLARLTLKFEMLWIVEKWGLLLGALCAGVVVMLFVFRIRPPIKRAVVFTVVVLLCVRLGFLSSSSQARSVTQLDVGQGDSALLRTGEEVGLIDAGAERALDPSMWLRIFARNGISRLSWIVLTHLDEDHSGGIFRIAQILAVGAVYVARGEAETSRGKVFIARAARLGIPVVPLEGNASRLPVEVLSLRGGASNEQMSVVWFGLGKGRGYLSLGDLDEKKEPLVLPWVLKRIEEEKVRDLILKLGHHGARTSSSLTLLRSLQPAEAWISAGFGNRYGHPSKIILNRMIELGVPLRRTDLQGKIELKI